MYFPSTNTTKIACTNICICFPWLYSDCWINFVDNRGVYIRLEYYCSRRAHVKKDANCERLRDLLFNSWFSGHFYPEVRQILTFLSNGNSVRLKAFRHDRKQRIKPLIRPKLSLKGNLKSVLIVIVLYTILSFCLEHIFIILPCLLLPHFSLGYLETKLRFYVCTWSRHKAYSYIQHTPLSSVLFS